MRSRHPSWSRCPLELAGHVLSQSAFAALDDNGARPIQVEHLGLGELDAALVLDTAGDVSLEAVTQQQAAAVEVLRHLDGARELGVYTSTARSLQPPTHDHRPASRSSPACVRRVIATSLPGCSARSPTSAVIRGVDGRSS